MFEACALVGWGRWEGAEAKDSYSSPALAMVLDYVKVRPSPRRHLRVLLCWVISLVLSWGTLIRGKGRARARGVPRGGR